MLKSKYSFILLSLFAFLLCTSCAVLDHKVSKNSIGSEENPFRVGSKNKFIRVKTTILQKTDNNMLRLFARENLDYKRVCFHNMLINYLSHWDSFDLIHDFPSTEAEEKHPKLYNDDLSLEITIEDTTIKEYSNTFLRVVSFGFSPQKIRKQLSYNLVIKDLKKNKSYVLKKDFEVDLSFKKLGDSYPWDLSHHGWFIQKQAELYIDLIKPDLSKFFDHGLEK